MIPVHRSSFIVHRSSDTEQPAIVDAQLDHHRIPQPRMRNFVEQHDPTIFGPAFILARARDVHDLVIVQAALFRDRGRALTRFDRENASLRARRIVESAEDKEEDCTDRKPRRIDPPKHTAMIRGRDPR